MNHLKIGTRLGLAFGLILLITALIATVGVWRLSTLKEATVRISSVEIERNELAMHWKAAIDLNWVRASAALTSMRRRVRVSASPAPPPTRVRGVA